jgi:hypothetical protein
MVGLLHRDDHALPVVGVEPVERGGQVHGRR